MGAELAAAFLAANTLVGLAEQRNAARLARRRAEHENALLELEARRLRNEAEAADAQDAQNAAAEQRRAEFESEERRRRLARAQAAERASLAGRGLSQDGSGEALLRSLLEEHDREEAEAGASLNDRLESIRRTRELRRRQLELGELGLAQRRQWNLLEASARRRDARLGMLKTLAGAGSQAVDKFDIVDGRLVRRS